MSSELHRPVLTSGTRYRWDKLRQQHQLLFPEGILVLNDTGGAIVQLCDGRSMSELLAALGEQFPDANLGEDVQTFFERLTRKGLLRDAADA